MYVYSGSEYRQVTGKRNDVSKGSEVVCKATVGPHNYNTVVLLSVLTSAVVVATLPVPTCTYSRCIVVATTTHVHTLVAVQACDDGIPAPHSCGKDGHHRLSARALTTM